MLRFMFGAALSALAFFVFANHPETVHRGIEAAREQIAVASENISRVAAGDRSGTHDENSNHAGQSTTVDAARARGLVVEMKTLSNEELWAVMDETDYDRRAAAGTLLLRRAHIPPSEQGVDAIKSRYFRSGSTEDLMTGFSYLGLLAQQGVSETTIVGQAERFVERYPRHEACDYAVWSLGELGSPELVPYFFEIAGNSQKYGPAARERAFCCLSQCGRYSPDQRLDMVPEFIELYEHSRDSQTRSWSLQALAHCAPGVRARSIADWKSWWARQDTLSRR